MVENGKLRINELDTPYPRKPQWYMNFHAVAMLLRPLLLWYCCSEINGTLVRNHTRPGAAGFPRSALQYAGIRL